MASRIWTTLTLLSVCCWPALAASDEEEPKPNAETYIERVASEMSLPDPIESLDESEGLSLDLGSMQNDEGGGAGGRPEAPPDKEEENGANWLLEAYQKLSEEYELSDEEIAELELKGPSNLVEAVMLERIAAERQQEATGLDPLDGDPLLLNEIEGLMKAETMFLQDLDPALRSFAMQENWDPMEAMLKKPGILGSADTSLDVLNAEDELPSFLVIGLDSNSIGRSAVAPPLGGGSLLPRLGASSGFAQPSQPQTRPVSPILMTPRAPEPIDNDIEPRSNSSREKTLDWSKYFPQEERF